MTSKKDGVPALFLIELASLILSSSSLPVGWNLWARGHRFIAVSYMILSQCFFIHLRIDSALRVARRKK